MNYLTKSALVYILLAICMAASALRAQVTNTATLDTADFAVKGKVIVNGYVDTYYGYDFSNPVSNTRSYFVSMAQHNEMTLNLAYADIKYASANFRARFVPGFGTYINANYAAEPGVLKNIVEGYVGIRLSAQRNIWLDAGVLGSPYTNESAISRDHLMYTRSFAPEYVPYYLSGIKLSIPLSTKVSAYLYGLNGWQVIQDNNRGKAFGSQLEWRPTDKVLINWNTYVGDERSNADTLAANQRFTQHFRTRYFTDVYVIYNPTGRFSGTACAYMGWQERVAESNPALRHTDRWWTVNVIGRYRMSERWNISGRLEYFSDPKAVQIAPITTPSERGAGGFETYSASLGINLTPSDNVMVRFEGRSFWADRAMYYDANGKPTQSSHLAISNITIFF